MKVIVDGIEKPLSEIEILARATGQNVDDCKTIISLSRRLQTAEHDRDYWRDLAITTQQKYEELLNDTTRSTLVG